MEIATAESDHAFVSDVGAFEEGPSRGCGEPRRTARGWRVARLGFVRRIFVDECA